MWVSVCEAIYQGRLLAGVKAFPDISYQAILDSGVSEFRSVVSGQQLQEVIGVATRALLDVECSIAAVSAFGLLGCLFLKWKSVHEEDTKDEEEHHSKA